MRIKIRAEYIIDVVPIASELHPAEDESPAEVCDRVHNDLQLHVADSLFLPRNERDVVLNVMLG
jgi:hypothetical protein